MKEISKGDIVNVSSTILGMTNKPFRVSGMTLNANFTASLSLQEHQDSWYTFSTINEVDTIGDTNFPDPFTVQPPSSVTLAEVWFIGQLGTSALAAMALVFPLLMLMQTMSGGALGGAISASIARSLGAGQSDKAEQLIWHALLFALMGALIFLILFALGGRELLVLLGGEAQLLELAADYCWILFLGGASVWLSSGLSAVFRGMGLMGFSAMIMIIGAAIQIPLSGGLILGWFGLPQLGLMGAAVSTICVASVMSMLFLLRLLGSSTPAKLRRFQFQLINGNESQILFMNINNHVIDPVTVIGIE